MNRRFYLFLMHFISLLFFVVSPQLAKAETVSDFLQAFHKNPALVMDQLPRFIDDKNQMVFRGSIDQKGVAERLLARNKIRASIMTLSESTKQIGTNVQYSPKDLAENLVDPGMLIKNIEQMENAQLMKFSLEKHPWADSYWPLGQGLIANRYAEPSYPTSKDWRINYDYIRSRPASMIVASGDFFEIDKLSPAEKYDLALGDSDFTLTNYSWLQGQYYLDRHGESIPVWMGICHGWAAASSMEAPIPDHPVTIKSVNGIPVTFYPQDIKALQTMLWAKASPATRFVGTRCDTTKPEKNRNGRVLDANCLDTNPGTWHLSIVNQLGNNRRPFVMDGTYDLEVWNFPIVSFQYRYFNPQTLEEFGLAKNAIVPLEKFKIDKFREFRSLDTRSVIGVYMDVTYIIEIKPTRSPNVTSPTKTIRYIYDLELDANKDIIGGEWYSNAHPDFMWTYSVGAQARARSDYDLEDSPWTPDVNIPESWTLIAQKNSARGTPLYSLIRKLTGH